MNKFKNLNIKDQFLSLNGGSVAVSSDNAKKIYNRNGEWCLMNNMGRVSNDRLKKHYNVENIIVSFYIWDYQLLNYNTPEKYKAMLLKLQKEYGINNVVQYDFSVFYQDKKEIQIDAMYKNFLYLDIAHSVGMKTVLNFNNILLDHFDIYKDILPKNINTIMIDDNHNEKQYAIQETKAMRLLCENFVIHDVIIRTGKKKCNDRKYQLALFEKLGINVHYAPTEMSIMAILKKQQAYKQTTLKQNK